MIPLRSIKRIIVLIGSLLYGSSSWAGSATATFKVAATITSGCEFGTSSSSSTSDFGTLSFGTMTAISANVDVSSASGSGSIIVTCTPGTAITLALDYGVNGGSATERYLSNGSSLLGYQLYQDSAHSTVWGTGSAALSVSSFPQTTQTYTVYGRLFSSSSFPATGSYTDTVTVTLAY